MASHQPIATEYLFLTAYHGTVFCVFLKITNFEGLVLTMGAAIEPHSLFYDQAH